MVTIFVNNKKEKVSDNVTILQGCKEAGIQIPRFCYHEQLSIAGNCRMCLVEVDKAVKPIASCALKVSEGMHIFTNTSLVTKAREGVMEFLLANHPLDCPICDQGGECDLQDQALIFGKDRGRFYEVKRSVGDKDCGPLIKTVMTRCIHCTRCVRFITELGGEPELGTTGRGSFTEIGNYVSKNILSEVSGNLIDLCPVGALTSKPYAFTARSWELKKTETIDTFDSMCSNIVVHVAGKKLMRVLPIMNTEINQEWINDKTRFGYDGFVRQRLLRPFVSLRGNISYLEWLNVYKYLLLLFSPVLGKKNTIICGSDLSLESAFNVRGLHMEGIVSNVVTEGIGNLNSFDFRNNFIFEGGYSNIEEASLIILCGINLRTEMPLLLIRLRKEQILRNLPIYSFGALDKFNLNVVNIGNTYESVYKFFRGQNKSCRKFIGLKKPMVIMSKNFYDGVESLFFLNLIKKLPNLIKKGWYGLKIITEGSGTTGNLELGLTLSNNSRIIKKLKPSNLYKIRDNSYKVRTQEKYHEIYQGSHGNSTLKNNFLIIPGVTSFEGAQLYVNNEGRAQKSKLIFSPVLKSRDDHEILLFFKDYIVNKELKSYTTNNVSYSSIMSVSNLLQNLKGFVTFSKNSLIKVGKQKNGLIVYEKNNFFKINNDLTSSRVLLKCSKTFTSSKIINFAD